MEDILVVNSLDEVPGNRTGVVHLIRNQRLIKIVNYHQGILEGVQISYYPSGPIKLKGFNRSGMKQGEWQHFSEEGFLQATGDYKDDQQHGIWKSYSAENVLHNKAHYVAGIKDGIEEFYHPNGQVKCKVSYSNGKRSEDVMVFAEDGSFKFIMNLPIGSFEGEKQEQ